MLQLRADVGVHPEAQCGNHLAALRTIKKIKRDNAGGDGSDQAEEFTEAEIEKRHLRNYLLYLYCTTSRCIRVPKMACSTGSDVERPT